ncbi:MAG: NAD(P)H-hydrate dehydratase [Arcobacter butzleri]|nr:NAD(P)H-hydrate dehydratase [Aliarcobacter butzleri]
MKKVYKSVDYLDKKCYEQYSLSEEILQEHAALALKKEIKKQKNISSILIVCGSGNNGADGIALARLLQEEYVITLCILDAPKSPMAKVQLNRALKLDIEIVNMLPSKKYDLIVDCIFGSGLNKELNGFYIDIITTLNSKSSLKLSCDIPSGIDSSGIPSPIAFRADITVTMGAIKLSLLSDIAKEYIGKLKVANLGLDSSKYEEKTNFYYLEKKDLSLPFRTKHSSHKGSFGHVLVVAGDKIGASLLSSKASFILGAGLVSLLTHDDTISIPIHLLRTHKIPYNTTAIAIGMGLGNYEKNEIKEILNQNIAKVCDADLFYDELVLDILDQENLVLTPHPKEFVSLLKLTNLADIDIKTLQENRFFYCGLFTQAYPKVTLLLKGANMIIAKNDKLFINALGSSVLSQGGSGDVLSGFIASYLAQGYDALHSAINGSLALALSAKKYKFNNFSLKPQDLIKGVKKI